MNRFALLIFSFLFGFSITIGAAHTEKVNITFNESDFILHKDENGAIEISTLQHLAFYGEDDGPGIPYFIKSIAVPAQHKYVSMDISCDKHLIMENVVLAANPLVLPTNYTGPIPVGRVALCTESVYPAQNCEYLMKSTFSSFGTIDVRVSPFVYNVDEKKLYFVNTMEVRITTEEENAVKAGRRVRPNREIESFAMSSVINPEAITSPMKASASETGTDIPDSMRIDYVIVTNEYFKSKFERLAKWKRTKGVRSKVVTMEEVESSYPGTTSQLKLKNCLYNLYENHGLQYALLGGGDNVVPVIGCKSFARTRENVLDINDMPTDLYYACFGGNFEWNANGNDIYGEKDDGIDLNPYIYISRVPINSIFYVDSIIDKQLQYEQRPQYRDSILLCGSTLYNKDTVNVHNDARDYGNILHNIIKNKWDGNVLKFYDVYTDFEGCENYDVNVGHMAEQIEQGYSIVDIYGHGGQDTLVLEHFSPYTIYSVTAQHNRAHTLITTISCTTNSFDYKTFNNGNGVCISENFIRRKQSGVIGYLGCSREGFKGTSTDYNNEFYKLLFSDQIEDKNFAKIVALSKKNFISNCASYNTSRWIQFGLNPIGDPEMPIFTEHPSKFDNATIAGRKSSITVDTGVDGCRICVMSSNDDGASYYKVMENVRNATFTNLPEQCNVCITKQNYIPKQFSVRCIKDKNVNGLPSDGNIITKGEIYEADIVIIESSKFANGNITIDSDNVTIESTFNVENSANLSIGKSLLTGGGIIINK